jgi:hypothetical protein
MISSSIDALSVCKNDKPTPPFQCLTGGHICIVPHFFMVHAKMPNTNTLSRR